MATAIQANGKTGKKADRRLRRLRLKTERDNIVAALAVWPATADYNTQVTNFATLKDLYREERKALRDALQALRVIITAELEEMAEEEAERLP